MKVEYHKSFERDLRRVRDQALLVRVKAVLLELENLEALESISGAKQWKDILSISGFASATIDSDWDELKVGYELYAFLVAATFTENSPNLRVDQVKMRQ